VGASANTDTPAHTPASRQLLGRTDLPVQFFGAIVHPLDEYLNPIMARRRIELSEACGGGDVI